jgi:hypothetical protein
VGCEGTVGSGFMETLHCLFSHGFRVSGQPFAMLTCIKIWPCRWECLSNDRHIVRRRTNSVILKHVNCKQDGHKRQSERAYTSFTATRVSVQQPYILQRSTLWVRVTDSKASREPLVQRKMYRNSAKQKYHGHFTYTIRIHCINYIHPSRWLRFLRRRSAAALLLGLRVRIPPGSMYICLLWVFCVVR